MTKSPQEARAFYEHQRSDPGSLMNWGFMAQRLLEEYLRRKGATLAGREATEFLDPSEDQRMIKSARMAEFFSDENPPRMVVGETEEETHEELREKHPSTSRRISGKLIELNRLEHTFFSLDPIANNNDTLPTETRLPEVIDMLLDKGIIPVNALLEIIIPGVKTPQSYEDMLKLFGVEK